MKYSKAVHVTKHKIREDQNFVYQLYAKHNRDYKYDKANNFACQYDSKNEHPMCTCKIPKRQKLRYVYGSQRLSAPRLKCAYHASSSYTDIGVGSVQALQKRRVRKIYLPETDDRGCGSSDLTSFIVRKNKPNIGSYYDYKRTSSKCVGGILEYKMGCVLSQKLSPIYCRKSNTTNTTNISDQTHTEIGSNTIGSSLVTTGTQFELASQKSVGPSIKSHDENSIKIASNKDVEIKTTVQASKVPVKVSEQTPKIKKTSNEQKPKSMEKRTKDAVSSDSLVEHVHNLEDSSYEKQSRTSVDPMENKLEREYRRLFSSKNKESFSKTSVDKPMPEMKSASIVKRRFEALRRGLTKKDEVAKKSVSPSSQDSVQSHKDESITSDPPSLESRSFTDTKKFTPTQSNAKNTILTINKAAEENAWPQKDTSSESQGVKGMFKLWGKKFDFDEEQKAKHSQNLNKNALAIDIRTKPHKEKNITEENKKNKKKFFFFKKKPKEKPEMPDEKERERELYQASGVTAGRCEIEDGLTLKLGHSQPTEPLVMPPSDVYSDSSEGDEIRRRTWLKKFLSNTIESTRSVNVRWNNSMYAASSSTVFELMDTLYKNTDLVLKSRSDIITDSSYYTRPPKNKVNFDQKIEAWMIPKLITDRPKETIFKIRSHDGISINLTSSDPRWVIEKSRAFANKIEVVLHSNNYNRTTNRVSSDYLRIDIPKDFFDLSSSDASKQNPTSDEEVFKIVEYESDLNNQDLDKGDHAADNINIVVSLQDSQHLETKILTDIETVIKRPPLVRDVVIQGSNVIIPKRCDVIGVGIITQRDIRDIRKPILKIQDISDNESEEEFPDTPHKKCEFAESYLQEYYRNLQPLGADLFAWCASDSHLKSGSEGSLTSLLNQGDGSKSCPNICDDYQSSAVVSSCNTSSCSQCYEPTSFSNKLLNKILKPVKAKTDTDVTCSGKRILPKDSLEVFKRRKIYAAGLKSAWACSEDNPVSVPSIESKAAQDSIFIECPKYSEMDRYPYKPKTSKRNDKHARLREQPIQVIPSPSYNTEPLVTISDIPQTSVPLSPRESLQKQPPSQPLPHSKSEPRPPTSISSHTKRSLKAFLPKNTQGIASISFKAVPPTALLDFRQSSPRQRRSQITTIVVGRSVSRNSSPIATGQPCGAADCDPEKCSPEFCQPPRYKGKSSKLPKKSKIKHHGNEQKQSEFQDTHRSAAPTKEKKQTEFKDLQKPSTPDNLDSAQIEYKEPKTEYKKPRNEYDDQKTEYEEPTTDYEKPRNKYKKPRTEYEEPRTEHHDPPSNLNDQPYTPDHAHKPTTTWKQKREDQSEVSLSFEKYRDRECTVQTCTPQQSASLIKYTEHSERAPTIETASSANKTHSPCCCKDKSKKSKSRSFFKKSQSRLSPCDCHQEMKLSFKAIPRMPRCSTPTPCKKPPPCRPKPCTPPPCRPKPCTPPTCKPKPCTPPTCKPKPCTPPSCKPAPCKPPPCTPPPCKRAPCPPPPCVPPPCKPPPCSPPPCSPPPCAPPPCAPKPCYKPPCPPKTCCKSMPKLCPPYRPTPRPPLPCSSPPCSPPPCRPKRSCSPPPCSPPPCPRKRSCSPPRCDPPPCSPPPCRPKRSCSPPRCDPPPCSPPPCRPKRSCSPPRCDPPPCSPPPCRPKRSCSPPRCDPPPCPPKRSCSPPKCDPPPCSPPPCRRKRSCSPPRCDPPPCPPKRSCSPPKCDPPPCSPPPCRRKRSCSPPRCDPSPCSPPPCRSKRSCSPPRCPPKRSCSPPRCPPKRTCSPPRCSPPPCPKPRCSPPPCTPPPCRPKRSCSPPKCSPKPCSKPRCSPPPCSPPPCSPPPCPRKRSCSPPKRCFPPPCPKPRCSPPRCTPPPCSPPPCPPPVCTSNLTSCAVIPRRSCSPPPCQPPPCPPKRSCSPPRCAPPPCSPPPCRPQRSCSPPRCLPEPCSPPPCFPPPCAPPKCKVKKRGFCGSPSPCASCVQQYKYTKSLPCSPKPKKKCCCLKKPRKCPATKQNCHCASECASNPRLGLCCPTPQPRCPSPPRCRSPPRCSPPPCSPPPCPKPRCSPPPCSPPPCKPRSCSSPPCPPPSCSPPPCSPPPCPPKRCAPPRCRSPPRCSPPPCSPPPCPRPRCSPPRCRSSQICVRTACSAPPVLIRGHSPIYPMESCCCTTCPDSSPCKVNTAETESFTQPKFDKCPDCSPGTKCVCLKEPSEKNNECPQNCQIEQEFIQLNSCENLTIIRKKSSTEVTRDGMNIKVRDCDGHTLYERTDYGDEGYIDNEGRRSSILNEVLYKNSDMHGVSTPMICNMSTEGKDAIVMAEDNSEGNLLEIQFKLRITKGDKTTEIHIGNDGAEPSREINNIKQRDKSKNNIEKVPTGVFLVKKDTKQIVESIEDINPKHDINIKIIVKSYKTLSNKDTEIKKNKDTFTKKISNKFNTVSTECNKLNTVSTGFNELNTVSTGYSDTAVNQIDEKVFSIHRTTIDFNSSEETYKTFIKGSMHSTEKDKAFVEPNNVISSNVYASSMTDASDVEKTTSAKNQDDPSDRLEYVDTTANEKDLDTSLELLDLNTSDECSDVKYSAKETQKELLKKVLENSHNKPKNKENVRQLRDMLKIILTDSSDNDDAGTVRCELVKDVTYQSLEQNYFRNTDSMINYYRTGSSQSIDDLKETPNFQSADENSVYSDSDKPECQGCMCSVLAKSLNCNLANSCCCKQTKVNRNISCYLLNDQSDHDSEENNVETQISKQPSQMLVSATVIPYKTEPVREIQIRDSHKGRDILQINTVVSKYANDYSIEYSTEPIIIRESYNDHSYEAVVDSSIAPETQIFKQTKSYFVEYKAEPIIMKQLKQDAEINQEKEDGKEISVSNEIENEMTENYGMGYNTEPMIMKGSYREEEHIQEMIVSKDIRGTRGARNKTTVLGISDDDKIVVLSEETVIENKAKAKSKGKHNNNLTFFKKSDVLQCYAAKKAVLEIYAEKSISESGEHLVAKLPKFLMDKENKITKKLEETTANCYKSVCSKKLSKLWVKN